MRRNSGEMDPRIGTGSAGTKVKRRRSTGREGGWHDGGMIVQKPRLNWVGTMGEGGEHQIGWMNLRSSGKVNTLRSLPPLPRTRIRGVRAFDSNASDIVTHVGQRLQ